MDGLRKNKEKVYRFVPYGQEKTRQSCLLIHEKIALLWYNMNRIT